MVDEALMSKDNYFQEYKTQNAVFESILENQDIDLRDKKSAIIDFISAGIETVSFSLSFKLT